MPIEMHYNAENEMLVCTLVSPVTDVEFREVMDTIVASDKYPPDIRTLWDARGFDFRDITRSFEERMVEIRKDYPRRGKARLAFVVADDLGFGMARMYEILSEGLPQRSRVFRSFEDGQEWLINA